MDAVNSFFLWLDQYLGSAKYFPVLLLGTGLFFTIYLKFPQFRYFRRALQIVRGKYDRPDLKGDTSPFQALATALSGTVGTGNIGGVGLALYLGGPAALFWMWATAFFGMATKFVEVTLSHKYRVQTEQGTVAGGPMYFMDRRLNISPRFRTGRWLGLVFAVAIVISSFGAGNMPQINSIASGMQETFGIQPILTGGVLAVILFLVIIGGIKRIVQVTEKIVPLMAIIYIVGALGVIFGNLDQIIPSFVSIFSDLFNGSAAAGGFLGASFAYALDRGVNRGLFSNEAGQGSAPIAHSAARGDEPVSEGMVSLLEPFIDTIVICTLTGLVILSSGVWTEKFQNDFQRTDMVILEGTYDDQNADDRAVLFDYLVNGNAQAVTRYSGTLTIQQGIATSTGFTVINSRSVAEEVRYSTGGEVMTGSLEVLEGRLVDPGVTVSGLSLLHSVRLTTKAFMRGLFGDFGQYIVSIGLLLFAFSTAIAWSYYGDRSIIYLLGQSAVLPYRLVYCVAFFVASFADTQIIWNLSLVAVVLTTIPNLLGILLLRREMKQTVADYWSRFRT